MPIQTDFSQWRYADGLLTISMTPPVAIGAWSINVDFNKRFGAATPLFRKSITSGFNASSGITITDSGIGSFVVAIDGVNTSGFDAANYVFRATRVDSGFVTPIAEGFMTVRI